MPRNDGDGVGCGWLSWVVVRLKCGEQSPGIVIASKREGTGQGGYFICEAIPSGEVWDCFVPRNDGGWGGNDENRGNDEDWDNDENRVGLLRSSQ
ncbi:MAG: hypothetical protein JSS98_12465 [Bacteroidetes bacterium]|nr:hypothetical protein [Bacteroidota bacterium]